MISPPLAAPAAPVPASSPAAGPDHETPAGAEDFAALLALIGSVLPAPATVEPAPRTPAGKTADDAESPWPSPALASAVPVPAADTRSAPGSPADDAAAILGSATRPVRDSPLPGSEASPPIDGPQAAESPDELPALPGRAEGADPAAPAVPATPGVTRAAAATPAASPNPTTRANGADPATASESPTPAPPAEGAPPVMAPPAEGAPPVMAPPAHAADQGFDAAPRRTGDPVDALPVQAGELVALNGPRPVAARDLQRSHREAVGHDVADPAPAGPPVTGTAPAPQREPAVAAAPTRPAATTPDSAGPAAPAAVLLTAGRVGEAAFPDVTAASPALPATVPDQIVSAVVPLHGRGDGRHEVTLELRPEHLGVIRVEVSIEQQTVHLTLHAADPATGRLLAAALPELRSALAEAGLTAGSVGVGPDGGGGTGARRPNASDESSERRPGGRGRRTDEPEPPAAVATVRRSTSGGLDLFL